MKLSELKNHLDSVQTVKFKLPNGGFVPEHFHITEVGLIQKHFIDCGGTERMEKTANLQLWNANDADHRLKPEKLLRILSLSEKVLGADDLEIEVEYQSDTIGKYGLGYNGNDFELLAKQTACLASDRCGETKNTETELSEKATAAACCAPGTCC